MAQRTYSLRWRIIGWVSIPVVLSGLAVGGLALYTSWHEIEEVYDAQLIHAAKVLRQLTQHELREHEDGTIDLIPETEDLGYKYEKHVAFRIWRNGIPVTRSSNAVVFGDLQAPPGLSDQSIGKDKWRFFVFVDATSGVTVETAERYEIRYELIGYLLLGLLLPASLFIPMVFFAVWYGATLGLKPLAYLSRDVDSRDSEDLRSIEPDRTPREIDPLIKALNRLFARLKDTLARERDFTDNAAHELRTPLAAIKTQTQALRQRLKNMPECKESLDNLMSSIDRSSNLIDKLLSFSRLQKEPPREDLVDLSSLISDTMGELASQAVSNSQQLKFSVEQPSSIRGDSSALGVMIRNLVENAIKYTPQGGDIQVVLGIRDGLPEIEVRDNGPGISDAEKDLVLSRFYRIGGESSPGSGLGLAIVKWIADQHQATFSLSDVAPTGLCCTVSFKPV